MQRFDKKNQLLRKGLKIYKLLNLCLFTIPDLLMKIILSTVVFFSFYAVFLSQPFQADDLRILVLFQLEFSCGASQSHSRVLIKKLRKFICPSLIYSSFPCSSNFNLKTRVVLCSASWKSYAKKNKKSICPILIYSNFSNICDPKPTWRKHLSRLQWVKAKYCIAISKKKS